MSRVMTFATTLCCVGMAASAAYAAAAGGGGGLPWDAPLTKIEADLTGPTAGNVSLIAFFGVLAVLVFGGEINHLVRTLCFVIMGVSALVGVGAGLAQFGVAGATIVGGNGYVYESVCVAIAVAAGLWVRHRTRLWRLIAIRNRLATTSCCP